MATRPSKHITAGLLHDSEWINNCFMLPRNPNRGDTKISEKTMQWMYYTTADLKFTNTSLGGNLTVNNPPQFTTFADPPTGRLMTDKDKRATDSGMHQGMGQYYSEAIDDNASRVSLRFGVPEYKGLVTFFTGFYNANAALLANEGRIAGGLFYLAGRIIGGVVALPLTIIMSISKMARFFFNRPSTKYYWLKPAMPLYWNRVNQVANRVASEMGLVPSSVRTENVKGDPLATYEMSEPTSNGVGESDAYNMAKEYMPELFNDKGGIDIYRIVNKTSRMENRARENLLKAGEGASSMDGFAKSVRAHMQQLDIPSSVIKGKPLYDYLQVYHKSVLGAVEKTGADGTVIDLRRRNGVTDRLKATAEYDSTNVGQVADSDTFGGEQGEEVETAQEQRLADLGDAPDNAESVDMMKEYAAQDNNILSVLRVNAENVLERATGWVTGTASDLNEYTQAAMDGGSDWISFKVDPNMTEDESWASTATASDIQQSINGISNTVRSAAFDFSNFKTGFSAIDAPIAAVKDLIYGAMDSFQISGLLTLAGTGLVDIPQRWDESSSNVFSSVSYTMELRSAYGDPLSIYLNLYLPFICLLAGAAPISHGNQSYGAPMLCELHQRGRRTIRLGLIDSLSVTRGTGTVGWNEDGLPLGLDISFNVINMSSVMHMPIDTGLQELLPWNALFGEDNLYGDYMAALSNLTIADQTNPWKKFALNKRRWKVDLDTYFNSARIGNALGNDSLTRFMAYTNRNPPTITTL